MKTVNSGLTIAEWRPKRMADWIQFWAFSYAYYCHKLLILNEHNYEFRSLINFLLLWFISGITCFAQLSPVKSQTDMDIPHLRRQGTANPTHSWGKLLMLAGEWVTTRNEPSIIWPVWPKIVTRNSTVCWLPSRGANWPEEGKFDFGCLMDYWWARQNICDWCFVFAAGKMVIQHTLPIGWKKTTKVSGV